MAALAVAGFAAAPARAADAGPGDSPRLDDPFPIRGQFPLAIPFLDLTPRSAFLLAGGESRWSVGMAYENTMAMSDDVLALYGAGGGPAADGKVTLQALEQAAAGSSSGHAYYVDGETLRASLEGFLGLAGRAEVGVTIPLLWHTPGILDAPIESWHDLWGFPDGGRPSFARDQYVVGYVDGGKSVFRGEAPEGVRPGDVVLSGRLALWRAAEGAWALAASAEVKLPTGDPDRFDGSGSWDGGFALLASGRPGRSSLHFGAQYSRLGPWAAGDRPSIGHRVSAFGAYAFRIGTHAGFVGQLLTGHGPFPRRDGGDLGDPGFEIALGMRHPGPHAGLFEWALLENLTGRLNTPDVGVYFGWSWRLGRAGTSSPGPQACIRIAPEPLVGFPPYRGAIGPLYSAA